MKYIFGDIVIVDNIQIGVIVKNWMIHSTEKGKEYIYEVYVRDYNGIRKYKEEEIQRYMVRHKYLSEEEQVYQYNAINGV